MGGPSGRRFKEYIGKKKLIPRNTSEDREAIQESLKEEPSLYIDGTEQTIRRPVNKKDQKENYSGKKKKHTSKILIISGDDKFIHGMTPLYIGKEHDFSILKEEKIEELLPAGIPIYADNGFQGIEKLAPNLKIRKPKKKSKSRKLNGGEMLGNRIISRKRVKVEHAIGGFKRFKIASDTFRGITKSMIGVIEIACGLWNFHVVKMAKKSI